ncbi:MAG TPA: hypothetical protein VFH68_17190 [Polyangia bacterium]|nr:hypothetical protein [Polyangia bacterium]
MDIRRIDFRRMVVSGLAFFVIGPGCIPGSVSGNAPRDAGNNVPPDGGNTAVTTPLACSQTPSGCLCASRDELPDDLAACSRTSAATHSGEQGLCCGTDDLCTCEAFACKSDTSLGFCQCGATLSFPPTLVGSAIDACPASAGQKCCLTVDRVTVGDGGVSEGARVCICSAADCDSAATTVSNCTLDAVARCPSPLTSTISCK